MTAVVFLMQQEVAADGKSMITIWNLRLSKISISDNKSFALPIVCTDNMIYMDLCVQWKDMCQQSKFLQDKCPRTCGTCAPGKSKMIHIDF